MRSFRRGILIFAACFACLRAGDESPPADDKNALDADKAALAPLQPFVGGWKGVGQPRRGSNKDSWTEQADWAWQFADAGAAIVFQTPTGKYFSGGRVAPVEGGGYRLIGTLADGKTEESYTGSLADDGRLVFKAEKEEPGRPAQVSLRLVASGDRMLMLLEKRREGTDGYTRLAEVGYTRKGSGFGKGSSGPECVVTGGYGSMTVEHDGKTYHVCCTGCRDLFNEDPEGVLADYRAKKAKEKQKEKE